MKKNIFFILHRLFLFLSTAYIGGAVFLFIIFGPIEAKVLGHKISFTSLANPIRISLGFVLLSFLFWGLGTENGRATLAGLLKKGWLILQAGGLTANDRIYWIDNLRTLAILLVVFGHTNHAEAEIQNVVIYIYSFHMPLFFFISGLTFNQKRYQGLKAIITRKISTLIIPYFFFSFLGYGLFVINNSSAFSFSSFWDALLRIVFADTDLLYFVYDGPLWFLPCLFLVEIEFYLISFLKKRTQVVVIGFLVALGFIFGPRFKYIPWTAAGSLVGLLFYWLGFLSKERIPSFSNLSKLTITIFGIIISVVFCYLNGAISMAIDIYGNPLYFLLSALGGIIYVVMLITISKPDKILSYIGMNTLIIFGLHGPLLFFVLPKVKAFLHLMPLYSIIPLTYFPRLNSIIIVLNESFISLLLTVAQIGFICLLIPIFNKKLYFLLGRKKPHRAFAYTEKSSIA